MKRNAKDLQAKAKTHQVYPQGNGRGEFRVVSGSSGESYLVTDLADGGMTCTCEWSEYHRFRPCSHILACEQYLEQSGLRTLSFWSEKEQACRQHRPARRLSAGLWVTSRNCA